MAKKSIFDPIYEAEVLRRLDKLTADSRPLWGIMKPNQMLRHLIEANKLATGELTLKDQSTFFTRTVIRYFVLNAMVPPPARAAKSPIPTFPEVNVVQSGIPTADFDTELANYKRDLKRVISHTTFASRSPLMGKMSRDDWGRQIYSHANYHLKQFGL